MKPKDQHDSNLTIILASIAVGAMSAICLFLALSGGL
jgi:hypothetical protein